MDVIDLTNKKMGELKLDNPSAIARVEGRLKNMFQNFNGLPDIFGKVLWIYTEDD